jgi:DNA-binding transcriptional ArsR family regulator
MPILALKFIVDGTAEVMMHPARFQILQYLRESKDAPLFVDQISKAKGIHPRMVSHHLDVLQEQGLIESRYEMKKVDGSNREVSVRLCRATDKATKVLADIQDSMRLDKEKGS